MKYVLFAVASEGHFANIGDTHGRSIKVVNTDEINEFLASAVGAKEITDEEYYELFPDERPVEEVIEEVPEIIDGEIIEGEIVEVETATEEVVKEDEENENI